VVRDRPYRLRSGSDSAPIRLRSGSTRRDPSRPPPGAWWLYARSRGRWRDSTEPADVNGRADWYDDGGTPKREQDGRGQRYSGVWNSVRRCPASRTRRPADSGRRVRSGSSGRTRLWFQRHVERLPTAGEVTPFDGAGTTGRASSGRRGSARARRPNDSPTPARSSSGRSSTPGRSRPRTGSRPATGDGSGASGRAPGLEAAVEARPDGPRGPPAAGGGLVRDGRDVRAHRRRDGVVGLVHADATHAGLNCIAHCSTGSAARTSPRPRSTARGGATTRRPSAPHRLQRRVPARRGSTPGTSTTGRERRRRAGTPRTAPAPGRARRPAPSPAGRPPAPDRRPRGRVAPSRTVLWGGVEAGA
jgi:hypothetical protein